MRISDWSSDVCSSDLSEDLGSGRPTGSPAYAHRHAGMEAAQSRLHLRAQQICAGTHDPYHDRALWHGGRLPAPVQRLWAGAGTFQPLYRRAGDLRVPPAERAEADDLRGWRRSEEHTSELQSILRISYAVFCMKKKKPT